MARVFPEIAFSDRRLAGVAEKIRHGRRLAADDGLAILETGDLQALRKLADWVARGQSGDQVFFSTNKHINYSNICKLNCSFCRFSRDRHDPGSYEMSLVEIIQAIDPRVREVHLVGSLHPDWPFERYLEMVKTIKQERPSVSIKGFTAVEILHFSEISGLPVETVLSRLKDVGLVSLPGGGAEVFAPRVRQILCPNKPSGEEWLKVHRTAHSLGIPSNATMLYGHVETFAERIAHLEALRELQDQTKGFLCFVPLPFQPGGRSELAEWQQAVTPSDPCDDLKMIALSRLYLDNIPHVKAYWIMLGIETTIMSLCYGADDIDGTVQGEKIAHAAGAQTPQGIDSDMIHHMVKQVGKRAIERDSLYRVIPPASIHSTSCSPVSCSHESNEQLSCPSASLRASNAPVSNPIGPRRGPEELSSRPSAALHVGQISFVNVAPYFYFWRDSSLAFIKGPPRFLGELAREGKIDLAPLPLFDGFRLEDTFEPLGNFGIAATRQVMSVFLFSQQPIETLGGCTVSLSPDSATSVNLLKLLLREKYNLTNLHFIEGCAQDALCEKNAAAQLLIGDQALKEANIDPQRWPFVYDLAQLWHEWTSLPFTFARWVVRKSVPQAEKQRLVQTLSHNLDEASSRLEEICAGESLRTGIDTSLLLTYLRNFTFKLGPAEDDGIELFRAKLKKIGLLK